MLRIDVRKSRTAGVEIQLSGRLVDISVGQLGDVIKSIESAGQSVTVDLVGLTGIDRRGVAALIELTGNGARLIHCPAFVTLWIRAESRSRIRDMA